MRSIEALNQNSASASRQNPTTAQLDHLAWVRHLLDRGCKTLSRYSEPAPVGCRFWGGGDPRKPRRVRRQDKSANTVCDIVSRQKGVGITPTQFKRRAARQGLHPYLVLLTRVSGWRQEDTGSLQRRASLFRITAPDTGIPCDDYVYTETCSGMSFKHRPGLDAALRRVRRLQRQHPDWLVGLGVDDPTRAIRDKDFDDTEQFHYPGADAKKKLNDALGDIWLVVCSLDPDASFYEVKKFQESIPRRLKALRSKKGISKPHHSKEEMTEALRRLQQGQTMGRIASDLRIPKPTLSRWFHKLRLTHRTAA